MREIDYRKPILIIVDRTVDDGSEERARTSFWRDVLPLDSFDEVSVRDEKQRGRQVRINAVRVVIINWDAANGDFVTGSDDTLLYFMTRKDRREALLRAGGILVCEYQSGRGELNQAAYDAIFGSGEVQVIEARMPPDVTPDKNRQEDQWNNKQVFVMSKYKSIHPLIRNLPGQLASKHDGPDRPLFNFDKDRPQNTFYAYKYRGSVFNGWFSWWGKGWVPLLIADPRYPWPWWKRVSTPPPAVLLAKASAGGLMLASTMWIAGSDLTELVNAIVSVDITEVNRAHGKIWRRKRFLDVVAGLILGSLALFVMREFPSLQGGILSELGWVWGSIILYRLWRHFIWNCPCGVSVSQYAKYARKAFWETL